MTNEDKIRAKEVAIIEVESRIRTKEQAKQGFKDWLKTALSHHKIPPPQDVLEFWEEVEKQVDLL